jgi:amino acid transporter
VHARFRTPHRAIALHAATCCAFALSGTFGSLAVLSAVSALLIYLATALAVFALRRRDVRADGPPFRAPGGPAAPLVACALVLWLLSNATRAEFTAVGAALAIATGLYALRRLRPRRVAGAAAPAVPGDDGAL